MEEFYDLVETMSPQPRNKKKRISKGPRMLSLKTHFRRSLVYDNRKKSIIIIGSSSSSSSDSASSISLIKSQKIDNDNAIVISETSFSSDNSEVAEPFPKNESELLNSLNSLSLKSNRTEACPINQKSIEKLNDCLSKDKKNQIEAWVESVNKEKERQNYPTPTKRVNLDRNCDELITKDFKDRNSSLEKEFGHISAKNDTSSASEDIINDSFDSRNVNVNYNGESSLRKNIEKNDSEESPLPFICSNNVNTVRKVGITSTEIIDRLYYSNDVNYGEEVIVSPKLEELDETGSEENINFAAILDGLYGNIWRKNQDSVLPKSEKKPMKERNKDLKNVCKTERTKKTGLLYKNPYLEKSSGLTGSRTLISEATKTQKLPWMKNLKNICDSDTSSDSERLILEPKKLNFDDDKNSAIKTVKKKSENKFDNNQRSSVPDDEVHQNDKKRYVDIEKILNKYNDNNNPIKEPKRKTKPVKTTDKGFKKPQITGPERPILEPKQLNFDNDKNIGIKTSKKISKSKFDENHGLGVSGDEVQQGDKKRYDDIENILKKYKGNNTPIKASKSKTKQVKKADGGFGKPRTPPYNLDSDSSLDEWTTIKKSSKNVKNLPRKSTDGTYTFLQSLEEKIPLSECHPLAKPFRVNFNKLRDELAKKLFTLYNEEVFTNSLPSDMEIVWNDRLLGTAGKCESIKITRRTGAVERKARIQLGSKILDRPERLRNTLIHELCHAATWIINQSSNGHGPLWKAWARKAMKQFPELPPIKRCHDYVINTKYTYRCVDCGYSVGRHSKSINIERKVCGYCRGKFEVLINKTSKKGIEKSVPATPKKPPTGFALFVKENYANHKTNQLTHADVMKLLGQKFAELKVTK